MVIKDNITVSILSEHSESVSFDVKI